MSTNTMLETDGQVMAPIHLRFKGIPRPIELDRTLDLLPAIKAVFCAWPWHRLARRSSKPPIISITHARHGYLRRSPWVKKPEIDADPADAMCDLVSDMIDAYVESHQGTLGIHAAAVRLGNGLVVFPNTHRAGKSLLVTHLVHQGAQLFSDDVLLLPPRSNQGMATGVAPRLRLPIPDDKRSDFSTFLETCDFCSNQRYGWIRLHGTEIARLGVRAPIRAIICLNRSLEDEETTLEPILRSKGLKKLVERGFALDCPAGEVLTRISTLVGNAQCYRLNYSSPGKAASLLRDSFGGPVKQSGI